MDKWQKLKNKLDEKRDMLDFYIVELIREEGHSDASRALISRKSILEDVLRDMDQILEESYVQARQSNGAALEDLHNLFNTVSWHGRKAFEPEVVNRLLFLIADEQHRLLDLSIPCDYCKSESGFLVRYKESKNALVFRTLKPKHCPMCGRRLEVSP